MAQKAPALPRRHGSLLLFLLLRRGAVFFILMDFLAVFLYVVGTLRRFTESTQFMLLRLIAFFGLAQGIFAALGMVLELAALAARGRLHSFRKFVLVAAACAGGFILALGAVFVLALTGGNAP